MSLPSRLVCSGCGFEVADTEPSPFRCPRAHEDDNTDSIARRIRRYMEDELCVSPAHATAATRTCVQRLADHGGLASLDAIERIGIDRLILATFLTQPVANAEALYTPTAQELREIIYRDLCSQTDLAEPEEHT